MDLFSFSLSNLNPHHAATSEPSDLGAHVTAGGGLRLDREKQQEVPAKENRVPIGGIGPSKGSMAKIGKGRKRAPETT